MVRFILYSKLNRFANTHTQVNLKSGFRNDRKYIFFKRANWKKYTADKLRPDACGIWISVFGSNLHKYCENHGASTHPVFSERKKFVSCFLLSSIVITNIFFVSGRYSRQRSTVWIRTDGFGSTRSITIDGRSFGLRQITTLADEWWGSELIRRNDI